MATGKHDTALPARIEAEFSDLLQELASCGHQANELVLRTSLPRWCRRSLFFFLGYIAKSEGRVTETDIGFAEAMMKALKLSLRQRRKAIHWFQKGKRAEGIPALKALGLKMTSYLWPSPALRVAICLCHATQLQGRPAKPRRYRCEDAIDQIGLPVAVSDEVLESYASKVWITQPESRPAPTSYEQACQLLGVTRRESLDDIKRAYRKKVSECHPDKLGQQALNNTERAQAKDRLLRYQQAWELIKRRHNPRDSD
ncbi:DnaJ domain-containing protein [Marinobacter sp.]|uniref:DnaJ domain-containing protein n=1 Tax=Marinobacter sp. TaxID=50741 RepID=UPI0034A31DE3